MTRTRMVGPKKDVGSVKDRSVAWVVRKKSMTPRQFWAHVARLRP
jgi:hypothetical protein